MVTGPRRGSAFDDLRRRIERRRRHNAETGKAGLDDHPAGKSRRAPVIELHAPGPDCPAHPGQDRYDCEVCAR